MNYVRVLSLLCLFFLIIITSGCGGGKTPGTPTDPLSPPPATPSDAAIPPSLGRLNTDNKENAAAIAYQGMMTVLEIVRYPTPAWDGFPVSIVDTTVTIFIDDLCGGGTGRIIYSLDNPTSYTTTWNNCEINTGLYDGFIGVKITGEVRGSVFSFDETGQQSSLFIDNLQIIGVTDPYITVNGSFQFSENSDRSYMEVTANDGTSGEGLTLVYGELPGLSQHNLDKFKFIVTEDELFTSTFTIDHLDYRSSYVENAFLKANTPKPLVKLYLADNPYMGSLFIEDASNNSIGSINTVSANFVVTDDRGMTLYFDGDGNGIVDTDGFGLDEIITVGWSQLNFNIFDFYPF